MTVIVIMQSHDGHRCVQSIQAKYILLAPTLATNGISFPHKINFHLTHKVPYLPFHPQASPPRHPRFRLRQPLRPRFRLHCRRDWGEQ